MADVLQAELTGLQPVLDKLATLVKPSKLRTILRKALTKGTKPTFDAAKSRVPRDTGHLRKSLARKVKTFKTTVVSIVGPRTKFPGKRTEGGKPKTATRYAHLVEFGTKKSPAQPFMRPAFDATKAQSENIAAAVIEDEIKKIVAKG